MVTYQLVNNEELDRDFDFISVAPLIAEILEVDQRFVGTFFIDVPHVVFRSDKLDIVHEKQILLQNLGIYLDIKTIEKPDPVASPPSQPNQDIDEKVKRADEQKHDSNIELSVDEMIAGLTLADPEVHIKDKNDSHRSPNINYGELELDEFDPGFDKHKQSDD
ncbi:MAG: hypothetical protein JXA04_12205 [Gammaproteobacteria bacterium]|nr:hypothetical protein [Gammaproteobacteria bacterium]